MIKGVLKRAIATANDIWTGDHPRRPVAVFDDMARVNDFATDLIQHTKLYLRQTRDSWGNKPATPMGQVIVWARENDTFPDCCGYAQEITYQNLSDLNVSAKPFASPAIADGPFDHYATVMPYQLKGQSDVKHILLDPTFTQYAMPGNYYAALKWRDSCSHQSPAQILKRSETGRGLWQAFAQHGYAHVGPEIAKVYLESLLPTRKFDPDEAVELVSKPKQYGGNLNFGRDLVQERGALGWVPKTPYAAALLSAPSTP